MNKIIANILLFVMTINAVLFNVIPAFAQSEVKFEWNKLSSLNDKLEIEQRDNDSKEAFLSWDMPDTDKNRTYTLSYYRSSDDKKIEFIVTRSNEKATIEYKYNNSSEVNTVDKKLDIYDYQKEQYIEANKQNFPDTEGFKIIDTDINTGKARNVKFEIKKGNGAAFSYMSNIIKFKWDSNGKMYFSTDGIERGIIYSFDLKYDNTTTDNLKICTGIDTSKGFKVAPFANEDTSTSNGLGKEIVEQITRPITEYPGDNQVGVKIEFNTLKEFNSTNNNYDFTTPDKKPTKMVIELQHPIPERRIQIIIDNIYENTGIITKATVSGGEKGIECTYQQDNHKGTIILRNLTYSTAYTPSITVSREQDSFDTIPVKLPVGKIYTYPKYKITSLGTKEFYLEVEPYEGYDGIYSIYQGSSQAGMEKLATQEDVSKGKNPIRVSVPIDAISKTERYYRVDFNFTSQGLGPTNDVTLTSQKLHYKPSDNDIILSKPRNLEVVKSDIVKDKDGTENLYLTLKWDIDYKSVLEGLYNRNAGGQPLKITYTFKKGLTKKELEDKVFLGAELTFNNSNQITYTLPQNPDFTSNKIEIKESKTTIRKESLDGKLNEMVEATVKFKMPVSAKNSNNKGILEYPNIYFIAGQSDYTITSTGASKAEQYTTPLSNATTLTLDGLTNIEVAIPQNLKVVADSIDKNDFAIEYKTLKYQNEGDDLYEYNEVMLKNLGKEIGSESIKYDFYITQSKELIDKMAEASYEDKLDETIKNNIVEYTCNKKLESINFKEETNGKKIIDSLRENKIVRIKDVIQDSSKGDKQQLTFTGLDENQTYYVIARTKILPVAMQTQPAQPTQPKLTEECSRYSKIVSATTVNKGGAPTDNEKIPTAPNSFRAENVTLNSANLIWDKVEEVVEPDANGEKSVLEYEFLKVQAEELPQEFLKTRNSFEKTWENLSNVKVKAGIRTNNGKLEEFKAETKVFEQTTADRYEYVTSSVKQGNILDKVLSPNQIYFYYVRTVRMSKDANSKLEPVAYSVWVPLSITTKNVSGPQNLRVETNAEYNKENEVVISFDIPKMDQSIIGTEYELQYAIKEDSNDWSEDKTMPKDKLTIVDNEDAQTMKVTYKITGLKSGKMYTIKVRLFNKNLNIKSMYSNEVEHRTNSNGTDNDYDEQLGNWNESFKNQIEELKKQSYWFIKDSSTQTSVYYRPQYFDTVLNTTDTSIIPLASGLDGSYREYYLPASAIAKAFSQNKGFKITYKSSEIIFSPKILNTETNDAIKQILNEINKKTISDYFVKITVDFKDAKYIVNGTDNLSPSANITISLIGTSSTIANFDEKMYAYINTMLTKKEFSTDLETAIGNLVKQGKDNATMVQEVGKYVDKFKQQFGEAMSKEMGLIIKKTLPLQYVDSDIIYVYPVASGMVAYGYRKSDATWVSADTRDYLGKRAIFTRQVGEYIFAGKKLVINGLNILPNATQINNVILKYGLDDFLGKDGNLNLKAPMTRNMTIGCLARMAGATKTQDPIQFFKSKGITISTRNGDSNITSEEGVYLMMKVYEMKTGTKLDTIKITNYNQTKDIKNINKNYKKAVQVAFQTGIYNNPNMIARGTLSTQEFLTSVGKMATMLGM